MEGSKFSEAQITFSPRQAAIPFNLTAAAVWQHLELGDVEPAMKGRYMLSDYLWSVDDREEVNQTVKIDYIS